LGALHSLYDRFRDDVEFLVVYVREAHPEDGWVLQENRDEEIAIPDPVTERERAAVAETCTARFALRLPLALDGTDDAVARAYGGWPDRLYLVGRDGRIAYRGGEGPFGFLPEELEHAIERELAL
jgi:hypothetical protein